MKISVKVKTNSKKEKIEIKDGIYIVSVSAPATEGKANAAVIKAIAKHFKVPKSSIRIKSGLKSKNKVLEII